MSSYSVPLLALLLAACTAAGDCLPPPESAERKALRVRLRSLIHVSQCPGPPTPSAFQAQELEQSGRKEALLARVRSSPVVEDLIRVEREDEEASRFVNEADCVMPFYNRPEDPENIAAHPARLEADRQELRAAEAAFERVIAGCKAG